jgi:hypothetical protein
MIEHQLFVCECNDPGHQLIVTKFTYRDITDYENNYIETNDISLTIGLIHDLPFFKRIWVALRYLFKLRSDPYQMEIILSPENTKALATSLLQEVQ